MIAYLLHDPERCGMVAFDAQQRAVSIEEKPQQPRDHGPGLRLAEHRHPRQPAGGQGCSGQIVVRHRASNPRGFGSVVHDDVSDDSDLDLLVDPSPDTSLLDMACIQMEIEALLGMPVDVVTLGFLPEKFRNQVLIEARPI